MPNSPETAMKTEVIDLQLSWCLDNSCTSHMCREKDFDTWLLADSCAQISDYEAYQGIGSEQDRPHEADRVDNLYDLQQLTESAQVMRPFQKRKSDSQT